MNAPKRIDISPEEMTALLARAKESLSDADFEIVKGIFEMIAYLGYVVETKSASINRLLKMLFGDQNEKTSKISKKGESGNTRSNREEKEKKPGHGKNGAKEYTGGDKNTILHETLKPKDLCPACGKGKVYDTCKPGVIVRVTGSAPCSATVYELQRLRCNLCGEIFTAKAPEGIGKEKYDESAGAIIALLKYGAGLPFNRLEQVQAFLGIPLPSSTQWEIVEAVADKIHPVYTAMLRNAAQGEVIHNDDTVMKILSIINGQEGDEKRKGVYTTAIVSNILDVKVALFMTGNHHAGENLAAMLIHRSAHLPAPVQMCDALSRNAPKPFATILANCIAHARRKFIDVEGNYPDECLYVLEAFEKIYINDSHTRQMTPDMRLQYHQEKSGPVMDDLYSWLGRQLDEKKTEPNSELGKAISYTRKHWAKLSLFLRDGKAPLDNNICERALKKSILHRKNSLFYKTQHGAYIGDLFMSLIHTCTLCGVNPFEYLKTLQLHTTELFADPDRFLPWNYQQNITAQAF